MFAKRLPCTAHVCLALPTLAVGGCPPFNMCCAGARVLGMPLHCKSADMEHYCSGAIWRTASRVMCIDINCVVLVLY